MDRSRAHRLTRGGRAALGLHMILLCLVGAFIVASAAAGSIGANIGLGLGLLALALLGAPWSLGMVWDDQFTVNSPEFVVLAVAAALLNLVLHAAAWAWWGSRRG